MSINQRILDRYDASMDDEFERQALYRAIAISYAWVINLMFGACAVLAWVLPGWYAMWAVLPLGVLIFSMTIRDFWLRQHAPRPRITPYSKVGLVFALVVSMLMMSGIYRNILGLVDPDMSRGMIVGGVVGAIGSLFVLRDISTKQRQRDRQRLDAQLEEEGN
ncbi:hypothetical protein [Rothia sp. CCM 9416]|uniref:hypothetical protein n=1 Tax=Rothia sp. CCM 9416 TaxID=3402655 RepID=UPI003AEB045A